MRKICLTGIKPTGDIHLGNYLGAIRSAVDLSKDKDNKCLFFIADYHSLNGMSSLDRKNIKQYTLNILATYIACGLDPNEVILYKQSDIRSIFELQTILDNFTPKSLMNLAHSYKSKTTENFNNKKDVDEGINMGLFNYPTLMTSDILIFNTNYVPVGKDQIQHIEIAREIARRFNHGVNKNIITLPESITNQELIVIGTDGRKMSKSYKNTIPLFCSEKELKKKIMAIETDSCEKDAPKPINNNINNLYKHFCNEKEQKELNELFLGGLPYGDAKIILFNKINDELKDKRNVYLDLVNNNKLLEDILNKSAEKLNPIADQNLTIIKKSLGF